LGLFLVAWILIYLSGVLAEDQDCIEKQDTFCLSINHQTQKPKIDERDVHRKNEKGETPHPLKEEKARIRAKSGPVSFSHKANWCRM